MLEKEATRGKLRGVLVREREVFLERNQRREWLERGRKSLKASLLKEKDWRKQARCLKRVGAESKSYHLRLRAQEWPL